MKQTESPQVRRLWDKGLQTRVDGVAATIFAKEDANTEKILEALADLKKQITDKMEGDIAALEKIRQEMGELKAEVEKANASAAKLQSMLTVHILQQIPQGEATLTDDAPTAKDIDWTQALQNIVNHAFEAEQVPSLIETTMLEQIGYLPYHSFRVDFENPGEYDRDSTYNLLAENSCGRCLLVQNSKNESEYAAFPCPNGDMWFLKAQDLLAQLFHLVGVFQGDGAPKLAVERTALVRHVADSTNPKTGAKVKVFRPEDKGVLRVMAQDA